MNQHLCFVDIFSSANYLFKRLKEYGYTISVIHLIDSPYISNEFAKKRRSGIDYSLVDYRIDYNYNNDNLDVLIDKLRQINVTKIYYGYESMVEFTDKLANAYGVKLNDTTTSILRYNKYFMQEAVGNKGVVIPRQTLITSEDNDYESKLEQVGYPLIIKPVDSCGSMGLNIINSKDEFTTVNISNLIQQFGDLIVQQKITGIEYLVDSFSVDGQHKIGIIAKYTKSPYKGKAIYRSVEFVEHECEIGRKVLEFLPKILDSVGLENGFAHTELFYNELENQFYLIEVNPRISGGAGTVNEISRLSMGIDQIDLMTELFNYPVSVNQNTYKYSRIIFIYNFSNKTHFNGLDISFKERLKSYISHVLLINQGEKFGTTYDVFSSYLYVILASNDISQIEHDSNILYQLERNGGFLL